MTIVVDENIPYAREAFAPFGEVRLVAGRKLTAADLADAHALIVRSVTPVNAVLVAGSPVRFVGTATIGTDHLDIGWLEANGITWCSAAGSNARSVVEYVIAAVLEYCVLQRTEPAKLTLGIVGHGNIGSRLAVVARALGMRVLVNDPPLAEQGRLADHVALDEVLLRSDVVTLHVPYIRSGPHATHHLIGAAELDLMPAHALLINSARGAALDNAAALQFVQSDLVNLVLDVFESEPTPNRDLVRHCLLATPHIAGYSFDGKVAGTRQIADQLARFLGSGESWQPMLPPPDAPAVALHSTRLVPALREAIRHSYDIRRDDEQLRLGASLEEDAAWGSHFDELRRKYPVRREFANYRVKPAAGTPAETVEALAALSFHTEVAGSAEDV